MTVVSEPRLAVPGAATGTEMAELRPAYCLVAAPAAIVIAIASLVVAGSPSGSEWVRALLVVLWSGAGLALGLRRRTDRLAPIILAGSVVGAIAALAAALAAHQDLSDGGALLADAATRLALAALPAIALHGLLALPDGRLGTGGRRRAVGAGYVVAVGVGLALMGDRDQVIGWPLAILWLLALVFGVLGANARYKRASAVDRRRMQWIGWALAVGAAAVCVLVTIQLLTGWPEPLAPVALALTGLVPIALAAGTMGTAVAKVDRLLTHTIALMGLTVLVVGAYVLVVLGLGRGPRGGERTLLLLSMGAAAVAALVYEPARRWLTDAGNRLVYGERVAPDEALRTWGQRLTRSIPFDELLLQLCESLRKSMTLQSAQVWTGIGGHYELTASIPHATTAPSLLIGEKELPVVARAGVVGGTWLDIWLPGLAGPAGSSTRVGPCAHAGQLLGLIVCTRPVGAESFTEEDDRVITELARQVGVALHNVELDSALKASLEELQRANEELRASRARIVAAGDAERRKLERNLHDGAQQHLVALAVKLRLAKDAVDDQEPDAADLIEEIRADLQDAIGELRALAHGIFPPLLMSGGLAEALPAAATRAALPTSVEVTDVGRYQPDTEAAIYFCCMEALQNAGKHAGDGATARLRMWQTEGELHFEVSDDGHGFDTARVTTGHGFVNMSDRIGAIDGTLKVTSAPGAGTRIEGRVPVLVEADQERNDS
jgi:signal transduction histidine kinase